MPAPALPPSRKPWWVPRSSREAGNQGEPSIAVCRAVKKREWASRAFAFLEASRAVVVRTDHCDSLPFDERIRRILDHAVAVLQSAHHLYR